MEGFEWVESPLLRRGVDFIDEDWVKAEASQGKTVIEIPEGVLCVKAGSFLSVSGIDYVRIPKSVIDVERGSFSGSAFNQSYRRGPYCLSIPYHLNMVQNISEFSDYHLARAIRRGGIYMPMLPGKPERNTSIFYDIWQSRHLTMFLYLCVYRINAKGIFACTIPIEVLNIVLSFYREVLVKSTHKRPLDMIKLGEVMWPPDRFWAFRPNAKNIGEYAKKEALLKDAIESKSVLDNVCRVV